MYEELFEKLGLTKGEIKVYLALTRLGESTVGPITSESKVTKSKIYDILERLIEKGLVGYITKDGTKHFMTQDPKMIIEYLNKKEDEIKKTKEEINNILPQLLAQKNSITGKRSAEIVEGFQGIKAIREELMLDFKTGDTFLVLGAPKIANEKLEGWFLDFHKRRIERKVSMKIIYNANAKEYGNIRKKMKHTEVKYLPNDMINPSWIDVFNDAVMFVILLETPVGFVVRDKALANSFKSYFDIMWKNSIE